MLFDFLGGAGLLVEGGRWKVWCCKCILPSVPSKIERDPGQSMLGTDERSFETR
jgi:hypothetical protein